jgi:UDP-N-acetylmuramate-alanine ligase
MRLKLYFNKTGIWLQLGEVKRMSYDKLKEIKQELETIAETAYKNNNNKVLEELEQAIKHVRRAMMVAEKPSN